MSGVCVFSCREVSGVSASNLYLNRRDLLASNQRIEVQQPLFAEGTDVEVDTIQSGQRSYGIRPILQHTRRPHDIRRLIELRQRSGLDIIVELLVILLTTGQIVSFPQRSAWSSLGPRS